MTGIERLREFVAGINPITVVCGVTRTSYDREHMEVAGVRLRDFLSDIADQIELEQDASVADSPYDAILPEDREAIAWVREHGGLDSVKKLLDWVVGHCSTKQQLDFDFWLSGRVMHELGFDEDMADRDEVERRLLARLMPEGMEWLLEVWPKWSNGEYCRFGDWWTADKYGDYEPKQLRRLAFFTPEQLREWEQDEGDNFGYEWDFMRPSDTTYRPDKVEPPAPKALDADGVEVRVGDEVWSTMGDFDGKRTVKSVHVDEGEPPYAFFEEGRETWSFLCCCLTHREPVLAADGKPLREGETVWVTRDSPCDAQLDKGDEVTVRHAYPKTVSVEDKAGESWIVLPDHLTHERPVADTWERLEEDAANLDEMPCDYSAKDLVRRAKALAERGQ